MKFSLRAGNSAKQKADCIVLAVSAEGTLTPAGQSIDTASGGRLSAMIARDELGKSNGASLLLQELDGVSATRTLLVRVGDDKGLNIDSYRAALCTAAPSIRREQHKDVQSWLAEIDIEGSTEVERLEAEILSARDHHYSYTAMKSAPTTVSGPKTYRLGAAANAANKRAILEAEAIAAGIDLTRELGNAPPNVCNPKWLVTRARSMGRTYSALKISVLDEKQMEKLGMGALLGVGQGSVNPPRMIAMEHSGGKRGAAPIVLVGKGVTFDTGGINIKPSPKMDEMKFDMCGAATVFGVVEAAAQMNLGVNLVGLVASAENMPDGTSYRPGDVLTSMSGKTIEIGNTDAEGCLLLCDALTYAAKFKPHTVIDMATLTGACLVALGHQTSAVLANDDSLAQELLDAGQTSGDRCWQLPLWDCYRSQLDSHIADINNIGGSTAGTITAGIFLSEFAKDYRWAHLDIAGVAWPHRGVVEASGRPVPMLMRYLRSLA